MERIILVGAALLMTSACSGSGPDDAPVNAATDNAGTAVAPAGEAAASWMLGSGKDGVTLELLDKSRSPLVRLACSEGSGQLLVNVPAFRPSGSEERMTFGSGGEVVTLVADPGADRRRGGVTGSGDAPANFASLLASGIAVNYGAQDSGPHPAVSAQQARAFAAACRSAEGESGVRPGTPTTPATDANPGACRMQDGEMLPPNRLKAIGTEPFWGARIEGRCVTYSHPENQTGTRIWTQFSGTAENGTWTGFYDNQRFVLRTRPQPGCSDGMSDNRHPIAVSLTVSGEERTGCASAG